MKTITLSICIATYNRAKFIGNTLDSIVFQITDDIEIIILDGASVDNTEQIVSEYVSKYPQIRYIKHQKKGGVDQDYSAAVSYAIGKMCWLFTDDDILMPNSLGNIMEYCKSDYSLIVLNSEVRDISMEKVLTGKMLKIENDIELHGIDLNGLFFYVMPYISFIGAIIIDRLEWVGRDKAAYFNTEFVHVGVIFQKIFKKKILIKSNPHISIRLGNAQWSKRSYVIWLFKWPNLIQSFNLISNENKKRYSTTPSFRRLRDIIVQRSKKSYNYSIFRSLHLKEKTSFLWKLLLLISAIIPPFILKKTINIYLKIIKIENLN